MYPGLYNKLCLYYMWMNMIYPPVKTGKRKKISEVQFIKQGYALNRHLSSAGFCAVSRCNLILPRGSNICFFNHSAKLCCLLWHSSHHGISDISVPDYPSTSSVLPCTWAWHRWRLYLQNTFSQSFTPLPLKHLTDIYTGVRKSVFYVLGMYFHSVQWCTRII